jgi:hypothetical protein
MRYLLPMITVTLAACGPIPVQMSSQLQSQSSKQEVAQEVANDLAASQSSAHQSESKQGTNSMPVIIICNNNAANGRCATLPENSPLVETTRQRFRDIAK